MKILFVLVCAIGGASHQTQQPFESSKPKTIEIDGAKHPEQIPEYLAWEYVFRMLARTATEAERTGKLSLVRLSKADTITLYRVADEQLNAQEDCIAQTRKKLTELKQSGSTQAAVDEELKSMTVACRQNSLNAADKLLSALSPAGRISMTDFVAHSRKGMTVTIREDEVPFFRLPR